jgi:8-oxo-dGTP diphosphatase
MSLPLKWEFPGGKIKEGESPEGCLRRELLEELGVEVKVGRAFPLVTHRYPDFAITLYPFLCRIDPVAKITLNEHDRAAWVLPENLDDLDWAEADVRVVKNFIAHTTCPTVHRRKSRVTPPAEENS